jgi:imidazolonepropionase-like amidohydrolase
MMNWLRALAVVLCLCAACAALAADSTPTAINHVTVVDTAGGPSKPDMTVVVAGDRITDVLAAAGAKPPAGARVVDGSGKFLIPGLWDMHIHTFFGDWVPGGREVTLPLLLANGVTGARDMGSDLEPILLARKEIAEGRLVGPRLVISGPMLDGEKTPFPAVIVVKTPEDGRAAVRKLAGAGVDFIKIQSLVPRDAYMAIAEEARADRIVFAGHVPDAIRASEAARAGQKSFEHLIGVFEGASSMEDALLKGPKGPAKFLATYDPGREASLFELLAKDQTWQCPTLLWELGGWLVDVFDVSQYAEMRYAARSWREKTWPRFKADMTKSYITDPLDVRKRFVEHELGIVARLKKAGVPFLAGTDTPAGVGIVPGMSLHRELERFVAAGFTPLEALQTATILPARFLGKESAFGTVERGKIADLVLLDADPTADVRNTQRIAAVVANGRVLTRKDLDDILAGVERYGKDH